MLSAKMAAILARGRGVNSLLPSDATRWHRFGSTLAEVMAYWWWCQPLPQPWLICHHLGPVAFTWGKFHRNCSRCQSIKWFQYCTSKLYPYLPEANELTCLCVHSQSKWEWMGPISATLMSSKPQTSQWKLSNWPGFNASILSRLEIIDLMVLYPLNIHIIRQIAYGRIQIIPYTVTILIIAGDDWSIFSCLQNE